MASLADELEVDPAFADDDNVRGMPLSLEDEAGDKAYGTSSSPGGSARGTDDGDSDDSDDDVSAAEAARRRRRAREARAPVSPPKGHDFAAGGLGSLADEMSGGPSRGMGSLADEFGDIGPSAVGAGLNEEEWMRRDREYHLYVAETLTDSIRQTDGFLQKLRLLTGVESVAAITARGPRATAQDRGTAESRDDTAPIEEKLASIAKQLRDQTGMREDQHRELQECDRALRRAFEEGGEMLTALVEMADGLDWDEDEQHKITAEERDPFGIHAASMSETSPIEHSREYSGQYDDSLQAREYGDMSTSTSFGAMRASDSFSKTGTFGELVRLQYSTIDLVHSLGGIHEFSQIAHASISDAARRMRNARTVLSNWALEMQQLEEGQAWINAFEGQGKSSNGPLACTDGSHSNALVTAKKRGSAAAASRPDDIRAWTQDQLEKFSHILEDAHGRAKALLQPVHDPVLDEIAAAKA